MFLWVTPLSFFIFFTNRPYRGLKPRVRFFGWAFDWPASVLLYTPATSNLSRTQLAVVRRNLFNHKADALHWALGPFNRSAYDEEQRPRTHTNNDAKMNTKTTANSPANYATRDAPACLSCLSCGPASYQSGCRRYRTVAALSRRRTPPRACPFLRP